MKIRNSCNSYSTFLKASKLDIKCYQGLFKFLGGFGKFGDEPNFMKSCFFQMKTRNASCSTLLKRTKLDIQCFYSLLKFLGVFGKFEDQPNFVKSCFYR